jgi:hypothetical protein
MKIDEAIKAYPNRVIVWHSKENHFFDRSLWLAEKNGEVIDYHRKDVLIKEAISRNEQVILLTIHRGGQVSIREILPNKASDVRFATRLIVNGRSAK